MRRGTPWAGFVVIFSFALKSTYKLPHSLHMRYLYSAKKKKKNKSGDISSDPLNVDIIFVFEYIHPYLETRNTDDLVKKIIICCNHNNLNVDPHIQGV